MQQFRKSLRNTPIVALLVGSLVVGFGGGTLLVHAWGQRGPSAASPATHVTQVATTLRHRGADPGVTPTATDTPVPQDTAIPTPTAVPTATAIPALGLMLRIAPTQESVPCDNHHYLPITITNVGTVAVGWNTATSMFATGPSNSSGTGNSLVFPGQSETTTPDGVGAIGAPGVIWTITVYQEDPGGQLGPVAGTVTIACT